MTAVSSKNRIFFGFCSTVVFWAILGAVLLAIPIKSFVTEGAKAVSIKLILPRETGFNGNVKKSEEVPTVQKTEFSQAYPLPKKSEEVPLSSWEKDVTLSDIGQTSASKPIHLPNKVAPQASANPVTQSKSTVSDVAEKSVSSTKPVSSSKTTSPTKAASVATSAEKSSASDSVAEVSSVVSVAVEESSPTSEGGVLKTAPIHVFEDNGQIATLPQSDLSSPMDVEEQFSHLEVTSQGLKFIGFLRNRGGKYALKSSSGDMRILSSPKTPKISDVNLGTEKFSLTFRVLPSGNVPLSGIAAQGCSSEEVANAVKVEVSSWKFAESDESSFLSFSCEASQ